METEAKTDRAGDTQCLEKNGEEEMISKTERAKMMDRDNVIVFEIINYPLQLMTYVTFTRTGTNDFITSRS